jgi:mRNA interferase MazF
MSLTTDGIVYKQKDILLAKVEYTDINITKKRPVLVVSDNPYNERYNELLVMPLTSNLLRKGISIKNSDLLSGTLSYESIVRFDRTFSIDKNDIVKLLGTLSNEAYNLIVSHLYNFVKLKS